MLGRTGREYQILVTLIIADLTSTFTYGKECLAKAFHFWRLRRAGFHFWLPKFYRTTTENILHLSLVVWSGSCTVQDRKDLASVIKTAPEIDLHDLDIQPLPTGARFKSIKTPDGPLVIKPASNVCQCKRTHVCVCVCS